MRKQVYEAALWVLRLSGLMKREADRSGGRATILAYHGVTDRPVEELDSPVLHLPLAVFRRHMELLADRFHVVPLMQLAHWIRAGEAIPPRTVVITFDDGYRNNITCALPVLRQLGLTACLFFTAGLVGTQEILWPDVIRRALRLLPLPFSAPLDGDTVTVDASNVRTVTRRLKQQPSEVREAFVAAVRSQLPEDLPPGEAGIASAEEVRIWHQAGMEVGSHSLTHPILSRLPQEALERELFESKRILEGIVGEPVRLLAYPNGRRADYTPAVLEVAQRAGYEAAVTTLEGQARAECPLLELPRHMPDASVLRVEAMASGWEARVQAAFRRGA